jgi:hypothetical protein
MGNIIEMAADLGVQSRYPREILSEGIELVLQPASLALQTTDFIAE